MGTGNGAFVYNPNGFVAGTSGDGTPQTFVSNLYRELLGRDPDADGLNAWVALLATNGDRAAVVQGFLSSPEYQRHLVTTLYLNFLGREPDATGLAFFMANLGQTGNESNIVAAIAGSDEYFVKNGNTNASFVNALYRDLLGRAPDSVGDAAWINALDNNQLSRTQVVIGFLMSPEAVVKVINGSGGVMSPPAGVPDNGAYALADETGNGYANLFFQGRYDQADLNAFVNSMINAQAGNGNQDAALVALLSGNRYYNNT